MMPSSYLYHQQKRSLGNDDNEAEGDEEDVNMRAAEQVESDEEEDDDDTPQPFAALPMYGQHKRAVSSVRLAPSRLTKQSVRDDAALCASASADGTVKIWDLAGPRAPQDQATAAQNSKSKSYLLQPASTLLGHSRGINDVAWSHGGDPFVATASDDKTLRLWDAHTGDALVEFRGHDNFVFSVQFNPGPSNLLVSGSFDETVKLWDVRSGDCVSTLPAHSDPVTAVAFNRDGTCLVSASHDGLVRIWDVSTGECLKTIFANGNPPVSHVTYSPNGKYVLASTLDSTLRLWPIQLQGRAHCAKTYSTANPIFDLHRSAATSPAPSSAVNSYKHVNTKYCISAAFLVARPHRRQCIVTGSERGHVVLWDVQSQRVHQVLEDAHPNDVVLAVDAHESHELLASGGMSKDRTVKFWGAQRGKSHHKKSKSKKSKDGESSKKRARVKD